MIPFQATAPHRAPRPRVMPHPDLEGSSFLLTSSKSLAPEEGVRGCHVLGPQSTVGITFLFLQRPVTPAILGIFVLTKRAISALCTGDGGLCPFAHRPVPKRIDSGSNSASRPENAMPLPPVSSSPQPPAHSAVETPMWALVEMAWRGLTQYERVGATPASCLSSCQ